MILELRTEGGALVTLTALEPYGQGHVHLRVKGQEARLTPSDMLALAQKLVEMAGAYEWRTIPPTRAPLPEHLLNPQLRPAVEQVVRPAPVDMGTPREKFGSHMDLYNQVAMNLTARILRGDFPPGAQLPSYTELATEYSISDITVRKAIDILRSMGLVRGERRRGVFVVDELPGGGE